VIIALTVAQEWTVSRMKELYDDENMNNVAYAIWEFLNQEQYTLVDLLKIITDVIDNRLE
jgi:hypothetical protein